MKTGGLREESWFGAPQRVAATINQISRPDCEHEPLRQNRIAVVSRAADRFRLRWTAVTKDINYYDGSKPPTQVEIEGEFLFKDIGKWVRG